MCRARIYAHQPHMCAHVHKRMRKNVHKYEMHICAQMFARCAHLIFAHILQARLFMREENIFLPSEAREQIAFSYRTKSRGSNFLVEYYAFYTKGANLQKKEFFGCGKYEKIPFEKNL